MPRSSWRNVRRGDPCEICGKGDWCSRTEDRLWAICRRVDAAGQRRLDRAGMEYWLYQVGEGPPVPPDLPDVVPPSRAPVEDLDRVYGALLRILILDQPHRQALVRRGLDEAAIEAAGYRSLTLRGRASLGDRLLDLFPQELLIGVPGLRFGERNGRRFITVGGPPGLVVPVRDPAGRLIALKVRRDDPAEGPRYLYVSSAAHGGPGPGAPVHVPVWPRRLGPGPVRVTEGELKADVASRLSGLLTISVPGVSAWRSALGVLSELSAGKVHLAFDADSTTNPHVRRAGEETARALVAQGYDVVLETWNSTHAKGIDDALVGGVPVTATSWHPPKSATAAVDQPAEDGAHHSVEHPYRSTPGGLVWVKPTASGPVPVPLTNFLATIVSDVLDDDGTEISRRFEVEARLNGYCRRFSVGAEVFATMSWATEQLGARAIIYPGIGLKDHARAAVQLLSGDVSERHVFTHSGWREAAGEWVYLHGGGALGARGAVPGFEVDLPDALTALSLPNPPAGEELIAAIRASLRLVDLAPPHVTFPLLGATYRAVLGEVDFALHLAGPTGAGKSEVASLIQRHFGAGFDARHLPGSWSSTANALELLAFTAKDMLVVIDDFAPGGQGSDVERAHRDADRVLRAQGNRSGRLRMRADGTLRAAKPPRGLILSTGEDLPRGQSIRARVLACELSPADLDWVTLTACQADAAAGRLAQALAGFVSWVAPQREALQADFRSWVPELRQAAAGSAAHRRTPDIVANLAVGWHYLLCWAESAGAINEKERAAWWSRAWEAVGQAAGAQGYHQRGGEPAQRFLELLSSAVASGRAHLASPDGGRPEVDGGAWGWRRNSHGDWEPKGERVGWLAEGGNLYLDSDASYAAVQRLGQEVGDRISVTPQTLRKRLKERGVLATTDTNRQVLTVRRVLEGQRREVLHLSSSMLASSAPP